MTKKEKTEKRVTNKQPQIKEHLYSLEELADLFGISVYKMRSMYVIRGLDKSTKLSYDEAYKKFENIAI